MRRYRRGSAPRVRGTAFGSQAGQPERRFSPARAGNGRGRGYRHAAGPVQPRACGERANALAERDRDYGSAPRVRGTALDDPFEMVRDRFSPARAGNGRCTKNSASSLTVQPRACGERVGAIAAKPHDGGSAPRVRGTAQDQRQQTGWMRFSPARAGNGPVRADRRTRFAVQPRACGERALSIFAAVYNAGSAPRVRGTVAL